MSNLNDSQADKNDQIKVSKEAGVSNQHSDLQEIIYEIKYQSDDGAHVYSRLLPKPANEIEQPLGVEPPVMKVVDVRSTWLNKDAPEFADKSIPKTPNYTVHTTTEGEDKDGSSTMGVTTEEPIKLPPFNSQLRSYIEITSPSVLQALRCVIDYAPGHNFSGRSAIFHWPYQLLVHNDDRLAEYQEKLSSAGCTNAACPSKNAGRHIGIVRKFVKDSFGTAIEDERKRHARGMVTYEMLWLLYEPGIDMLADRDNLGDYQPYVMSSLSCNVVDGTVSVYFIELWSLNANPGRIGPRSYVERILPFAGEVPITSLKEYPFEYRAESKVWGKKEDARAYFENRGTTFFQLQREGSWEFAGLTTTLPRRPVCSNAFYG